MSEINIQPTGNDKPNTPPANSTPVNITASPAAGVTSNVSTASGTDFYSGVNPFNKESKVLENITAQQNSAKPKVDQILGNSGLLEESLRAEKEKKEKSKLRTLQLMTGVVVMGMLAINGYLFYQLTPGIDFWGIFQFNLQNNLTDKLAQTNSEIRSVKTEINKYNYLIGQIYLSELSTDTSRFFDNVSNLQNPRTINLRAAAETNMKNAVVELPQKLADVKKYLNEPLFVETVLSKKEKDLDLANQAQTDLRIALQNAKAENLKAAGETATDENNAELALLENAIRTVGNNALIANLRATNLDEFKTALNATVTQPNGPDAEKLRTLLNNILSSSKSNLAIINNIKNKRLAWSQVIDAIYRVTNTVDNSNADSNSRTTYNSFNFNADNNSISISGVNKTSKGNNRTIVANLINTLEGDDFFKDVANRSFPLSKSQDQSGNLIYSLNFKIDLKIDESRFRSAKSTSSNTKNTTDSNPVRDRTATTNVLFLPGALNN